MCFHYSLGAECLNDINTKQYYPHTHKTFQKFSLCAARVSLDGAIFTLVQRSLLPSRAEGNIHCSSIHLFSITLHFFGVDSYHSLTRGVGCGTGPNPGLWAPVHTLTQTHFMCIGGNQSSRKKPTPIQGEHVNATQRSHHQHGGAEPRISL